MYLAPRAAITFAVAGVAAAFAGWPGFALANAVLVVALMADVLRAPDPARLQPTRELAGVLKMDAESTITIRVHDPLGRAVTVEVRDSTPPSFRRAPLRQRARVGAGNWVSFTAAIKPRRRGAFTIGPLTVRAAGPLGLAGRQRTLSIHDQVKVYPPLPSRSRVTTLLDRARSLPSGQRSALVRGGGTEFDSLREYHRDDEFRRINWRATARSSKPISNVWREERDQTVLILLDAGRAMAGTIAGVARFEEAIDAAVAVAEIGARAGDHVGMAAFAREVIASVPARGGRAQPGRILDALYAVEPRLEAPAYRRAFSSVLARHRSRAMLVLLTDLADEAVIEPLAGALPALLRHHLVVVGAVRDPTVDDMASRVPSTSEQAYEQAAAADALERRERAATRLRLAGAAVVDRVPGALGAALCDHYLRVKAYGRL